MGIHNSAYQKNANTALVLGNIWRAGKTTRVRIAEELGLYRSTVTNILNALVAIGIVREEGPMQEHENGRKPIELRIDGSFGYIVGIDLQPSHFIAVGIDLAGEVLFELRGDIDEDDIAQALLSVFKRLQPMITSQCCPQLATCVGIPGVVDTTRNVIRYAEPFHVSSYKLQGDVCDLLHVPLLLENDANCCAWWHLARDGRHLGKDFFCLFGDYHDDRKGEGERLGTGVGIGVSIGGKVFTGSSFAAGELHTVSWRSSSKAQSGLTDELLKDFSTDVEAYRTFSKDLFSSLVPVVSVLDPSFCFIHGRPFKSPDALLDVLKDVAPEFLDILEKRGCTLEVDTSDEAIVAKGAAMMYLQKLYSVPGLPGTGGVARVVWEDVLSMLKVSGNHC